MINCAGTALAADAGRIPDMFYISPYTVTQQPVFHTIAVTYGNFIEALFYLVILTAASYLTGKILSETLIRRGYADDRSGTE